MKSVAKVFNVTDFYENCRSMNGSFYVDIIGEGTYGRVTKQVSKATKTVVAVK